MNPLKLISQFLAMTQEQHDAVIKFAIAVTFCFTVIMMVGISLYSVVFVTQPMSGMAPADKQFFLILSDMSKYVLGSLATLLAVKGKDALPQFVPPGLSTAKERDAEPPKPTPTAAVSTPQQASTQRVEPVMESVSSAPPVIVGYGGKAAPPPAPQPEI
jgi:hypothetical protein